LAFAVGRYYDPGTDQFLSIDPDVAETGQPYAFTGDDPLNATDPLGLSGGSQGYVNYLKKYGCYGHGRRACHGLSIGSIAKKIARGVAKVSTPVGHADVAVVKYEASHPLQIAEASVGAVLLATPGAEIAGAAVEASAFPAIDASSLDLGPSSGAIGLRGFASLGLVEADTHSCVSGHSYGSCFSAAAGVAAFPPSSLEPASASIAVANALFDLVK
jgi:hypothetical protein